MERHRIGIVIPAYNEAETIGRVVEHCSPYGTPIVVDDASKDATAKMAFSAGADVVKHDHNGGYDKALDSGFKRASNLGCDYVITMDADGQHDAAVLASFIQALNGGADMVVGIRDRRQRLAEHIFAWVAIIKWGLRDPLCGMKGYPIKIYKELGHFDSYNSIGTELAIFAAKRGKKIIQIPIKTRTRKDISRFGQSFSANKRILRALCLALFGTFDFN